MKKKLSLRLVTISSLLICLNLFCLSQTVNIKLPLWLTDKYGLSSDTLYFGVASTPVAEPFGWFCNGLKTDLRQFVNTNQVDTFCLDLTQDSLPCVLHWQSNVSSYYDSVKLKDNSGFPFDLFNVNMGKVDSFKITNVTIRYCRIIAYGPHVTAGLNDHEYLPDQSFLHQNYPNPFNPMTNLQFTIANLQFVSLKVYDVLGREVVTIVDQQMQPGNYTRPWDASRVSGGVYFYRLTAGNFIETKKLILMK